MIQVSKSILEEAQQVIANAPPSFSTDRGDLYILNDSMSVIHLNVPRENYAKFMSEAAPEVNLKGAQLLPIEGNQDVSFLVIGNVAIADGRLTLNGQPVVIL